MKVQWHEFKDEWPRETRGLWLWAKGMPAPEIIDKSDLEDWCGHNKFVGRIDMAWWENPTHWAYVEPLELPEPPEGNPAEVSATHWGDELIRLTMQYGKKVGDE